LTMKKLFSWSIRNWRLALPLTVFGVVIGGWLAFGIFGIQTLFTDEVVDEALPAFAVGNVSGLEGDEISEVMADAMSEAMADSPPVVEVDEEMSGVDVQPMLRGDFIDRSHPTVGTAAVLSDGSGRRVLRLEGFSTDNGPDLNVYLVAAAPDAPAGDFDDDFVDLGDLKGNIGSQNYEIPEEVDLDRHRTVVIWCVRFGVAFGAAGLG